MAHDLDVSLDEFHLMISWVKGSPGTLGGGTPPLGHLAPPLDLEESASHHLDQRVTGNPPT